MRGRDEARTSDAAYGEAARRGRGGAADTEMIDARRAPLDARCGGVSGLPSWGRERAPSRQQVVSCVEAYQVGARGAVVWESVNA